MQKVLHIASFVGNIGDNANHSGFRRIFHENVGEFQYEEIEIRDFYFNRGIRKFDLDFVNYANKFDLIVIGGGNFFEPNFPQSKTGTTLDIDPLYVDKIKTPIFFNGVGFDPAKGSCVENINKLEIFFDAVLGSGRNVISVRNDGSLSDLEKIYGDKYLKNIHVVPDGGFFLKPKDFYQPCIEYGKINIAFNLAGDMLDKRFPGLFKQKDYLYCLSILIQKLDKYFDGQVNFIMVPHIYKDIEAISELFCYLDDFFVRSKIKVSPYLQGAAKFEAIFDMYKKCDLALGNRFHANVCPFGMNIPTIAMANYPKLKKLYSELEMTDRVVDIEEGFSGQLFIKIVESLKNVDEVKNKYSAKNAELEVDVKPIHDLVLKKLR